MRRTLTRTDVAVGAAAGVCAIAGLVVLLAVGGFAAALAGALLLGLAGILLVALAFLLVGESEDRDREGR
jgi:hypothetical protein